MLRTNKEDLTTKVKSVVYGSITTQDFEERWPNLRGYIGYQDDTWFDGLYKIRPNGVPVYLNHMFWAGMTTTQRAESMSALLTRYISK